MYKQIERMALTVIGLFGITTLIELIFKVKLINKENPILLFILAISLIIFSTSEIRNFALKRMKK